MNRSEKPSLGMILKGYPRISETFISNEILLLEKLGFSIHIFSMRQPRESFSHKSIKKIKAKVDYLPETLLTSLHLLLPDNLMLAAKRPVAYANAIAIAARRFFRTRKSATIKHLFQAGYLVNRFLSKNKVAHLHAHFAHSPTSVAMFASHLSGLPFSFTAHAKDIYTSDPRQLREKIEMARFVVTCTEYNRQHLLNLIPENTKPIHRVYHGIDLNLFKAEPLMEKRESKPFQILTVARMAPKKGLPTVYKALRLIADEQIPIRHTLIGDGDDREKILALIKELKLNEVTELCGTMPHDEVLKHFRKADLFVLGCEIAENGDRDGVPNVLVESMSMGVPVVATSVSGIPELVKNGETGLLVPSGQPEEMARAIKELLLNEDLRKKIIPAAGRRVKEGFDNKALIGDLAAIYEKYLR